MVLPLTPSGNQTSKMHHMDLHRWRQEMTVIARAECRVKCTRPEKRHVCIVRHSCGELDEHDNLPWGCKQIIDALVRARVLWDDSPKYVNVAYTQLWVKKKKEQKTVVVVCKYPLEYPDDARPPQQAHPSWRSDIVFEQPPGQQAKFVEFVKDRAGLDDEDMKRLAVIINGEMGGSSNGMTYEAALSAHNNDDQVRRREWPEGMVLTSSTHARRKRTGEPAYPLTIADCAATDWEVIDD